MTKAEVISQLYSLKQEAEYMSSHDKEEEIWKKDIEALEYAIGVIEKEK